MKIISCTLHKRTQLICRLCLQLLNSLQLSAGSFLGFGFPLLSSAPSQGSVLQNFWHQKHVDTGSQVAAGAL